MAEPWAAFAPDPPAAPTAPAAPGAAPAAAAAPTWAAFAPDPPDPNAPQPDQIGTFRRVENPNAKSGYVAATGASMIDYGAGMLNVMADPFGNLVGKPLAIGATALHDWLAPKFGYEKFTPEQRADILGDNVPQPGTRVADAVGEAIGAPKLSDVEAGTPGEAAYRAGVTAGLGMATLGPTGWAKTPANALLGYGAGAGGKTGASYAPEEYQPAVETAAGMATGFVPAAGAAVVRAGGRLVSPRVPVLGPRNPLVDIGGPVIGANGLPLEASTYETRLAGKGLAASATDPAAVKAALANPPAPMIPGDNPTTAKLTGDRGLATAEYTASRTGTNEQQAAFRAQADAQNDARVRLIKGIEPAADATQLTDLAEQRAAAVDTATAARVADVQTQTAADLARTQAAGFRVIGEAQDRATAARAPIDAAPPPGADAEVGAAARAPLAAAADAAHARRSAMYDAVDPGGKLALDMTPVRGGARQILTERPANEGPLAGKEAGIFDTASSLPDAQKFGELVALRKRITNEIMQQRLPNGDPVAVRRLSMLLGHVEGVMNDAAGTAEIAPAVVQGGPPAVESGGVPTTGTRAYTPSGKAVDVRYVVREAADLIPSQLPDGRPHPDFPPELQPRDRTRAASTQQINSIANRLNPELLGASASTAEGAPIVGPDGIVESGNGRTMAIQQAYAQGGPQADAYRQWIASQGHDITGMKAPVLVRERTTPMDMPARANFAADAGASPILGMSASERAAGDAGRVSDGTLQLLRGGSVADAANTDFIRAFLRDAVEPGGEGSFVTADGQLSKEGAARVEAALVHKAYGDKGLSAALGETTDPTARVLAGALRDAAGPMAQLRVGIEAGVVDRGVDLAPGLVEATRVVQQARQRGISLADAVAQQDAFSQLSPQADQVLRAAYGESLSGRMSQSSMTRLLEAYADAAQKQSTTGSMFGDRLSSAQLLDEASARYGKDAGTSAGRVASGDAGGVGAGAGQGGGGVGGPGNAAAGQAAPGGSQGQGQGGRSILPAETLTPNLDAAAIARYRAANAQNVADVARFRTAPGVGQVLQGGPTKGTFKAPDSAVPNLIVRTGSIGADVAQAFLKAGGTVEGLTDTAAFSLRSAAMKDGVLDPARYAAWAKDRGSFLSQIPDAAAKFGAAAEAQRGAAAVEKLTGKALADAAKAAEKTVNEAVAARATQIKEYQSSQLGKMIGADPVFRVGQMLTNRATGLTQAQQLVATLQGDPASMAALRRATAAWIDRNMVGTARGVTSDEAQIQNNKFQTFMRHAEPTLKVVLTPEDFAGLKKVQEMMDRDFASPQVGAGSPTAQLQSAGKNRVLGTLMSTATALASGAGVGAGIGGYLFGTSGSMVGSVVGAALGKVWQGAREAGIRNIADLQREALLNPAIYRLLNTKITPANQEPLMAGLAAQLRRLSLVSSQVAAQDQRGRQVVPEAPRNAMLMH